MADCIKHWSFSGLQEELETEEERRAFFKPTLGCSCVFGGFPASVRVTSEITPMGITNYVPKDWDIIESLGPAEFHERCWGRSLGGKGGKEGGRRVLVDVRNHYESRIGYFISPLTGTPAIRPGVRRFGQWPQFVKTNLSRLQPNLPEDSHPPSLKPDDNGTQYMTYCTGGIRCEKGARFLAENLERGQGDSVCTLKGGIQAYLMWMDEEIEAGRKEIGESLFKGKNYVFDARGSTSLDGERGKVADCHVCGRPEDRLGKCRSRGCHLILVVCEDCEEEGDPRCCRDCVELDAKKNEKGPRPVCECEKERELKLWGDKGVKPTKTQGMKTRLKHTSDGVFGINIQFKAVD